MSYTFATIDDLELPSDDLAALRYALHDERRFRRVFFVALLLLGLYLALRPFWI